MQCSLAEITAERDLVDGISEGKPAQAGSRGGVRGISLEAGTASNSQAETSLRQMWVIYRFLAQCFWLFPRGAARRQGAGG